jgi:hypothetical protein
MLFKFVCNYFSIGKVKISQKLLDIVLEYFGSFNGDFTRRESQENSKEKEEKQRQYRCIINLSDF